MGRGSGMRHDEIRENVTYVGRGLHRRTRHVLRIGPAAEIGVPAEHLPHLSRKATFVMYRIEDGTETYEALVSFAQWATSIDPGWPREVLDVFSVAIEGEDIIVDVLDPLTPAQAKKLSRWLLDAARDIEDMLGTSPKGPSEGL